MASRFNRRSYVDLPLCSLNSSNGPKSTWQSPPRKTARYRHACSIGQTYLHYRWLLCVCRLSLSLSLALALITCSPSRSPSQVRVTTSSVEDIKQDFYARVRDGNVVADRGTGDDVPYLYQVSFFASPSHHHIQVLPPSHAIYNLTRI